jgi:hypothetical protein
MAGWRQSGQRELLLVETTSTHSRSSLVVVVRISNPGGRGRKGDEDIGVSGLQARRNGSQEQNSFSVYHISLQAKLILHQDRGRPRN